MQDVTASDRIATLKLKEKLGYGFGDFGFNLYWTTAASFLAVFYTDVFGISAAAAGTMMFTTKIIDACTDPVMGAIADRTNTRFGKFRPYLLFAGLPMVGAAVLTFSTPDLDQTGKLIWAYCTYTFMMMMYTILSTPYFALSGVMTAKSQERTSLICMRFLFAFTSGFFVNYFTLDLVSYFGSGDDTKGWQLTMLLYGFAASVTFLVTFLSTKERVTPPATQNTRPVDDITDLLSNRAWKILAVLTMIIMITITMRAGSAYYYFTYFLERPDLISLYLGLQTISYAVGAAFAPLMTKFLDKNKLLMFLMLAVGILSILFTYIEKPFVNGVRTIPSSAPITFKATELLAIENAESIQYQWQYREKSWWVWTKDSPIKGRNNDTETFKNAEGKIISVIAIATDSTGKITVRNSGDLPNEIYMMFIFCILISLALGPKTPLTWAMYADTADYNEWKTGRRATAMTFSVATFSQKFGGALGSAGMLWTLGAVGYVANAAQNEASLFSIVLLQTAAPGVFALISAFIIKAYPLTGEKIQTIQNDLISRYEKNN